MREWGNEGMGEWGNEKFASKWADEWCDVGG